MLHGVKPLLAGPRYFHFGEPARIGASKEQRRFGLRGTFGFASVLWCGARATGLRSWLGMGKKASKADASVAPQAANLQDFASAVSKQLSQKQRLVRTFDVGGTGIKTALFAASSLQTLLDAAAASEGESPELEWIEPPTQLGQAPGEDGFDTWLAENLPKLQNEKANGQVIFGVSTAGDIEHATGVLHDWWSAGGHPRQWEGRLPDPHVADLMGLPRDRTFILHDGAAHLLGCSRRIIPPPELACFSVGTGVGFGISDEEGAVVDPSSLTGARSHNLNGVPVSGASYRGVWRDWVSATDHVDDVEKVMLKEFANMGRPWSMPWVSLVLGRRGMELAEAAFGCPAPEHSDEEGAVGVSNASARVAASLAYAKQWQHFLQTQFVPQFCSNVRRHQVRHICFAGMVATTNWCNMEEVLVSPTGELISSQGPEDDAATKKRGRSGKKATQAAPHALTVLPLAPHGSALIGAGIYALAGSAGAEMGLWAK